MNEKPGVMLYFDLLPTLEELSNADKGLLLEAILKYGKRREEIKLSKRTEVIWPLIRMRLDTDEMRYLRTVTRRQYAAYVRWAKRMGKDPVDFITWQERKGYAVNDEEMICLEPEFLPSL